ncbi:hypothetical protein CCACVL1_22087 [Corchorus capsularis]|uniref:Uncharacterized protein n=1 Tax=Corchorus capsularis TaxID=210143 RepID=A0A1R3H155_COCAP|nr:hypothetical protein CCACVL1_22087 [Corchorus capsularis]
MSGSKIPRVVHPSNLQRGLPSSSLVTDTRR